MHVKVKVTAPAGTIIINRPEKRNALSQAVIADLRQAFDDLHLTKSVRAVILTGAGDVFSAGIDLLEMHQTSLHRDAMARWHDVAAGLGGLYEQMLRFPKPIIAALPGPALGGGAGLALASDMVVASPEARFGVPETRHGLVAGVVAPLLFFRAGGSIAADLLISGRIIEAHDALRRGLYNEIVAPELVWARANELVGECARGAEEATLLSKRLLNETIGEQVMTWLSAGAAAMATGCTTGAAAEGLQAFAQRRDPQWP